jgi:hypothetical protein
MDDLFESLDSWVDGLYCYFMVPNVYNTLAKYGEVIMEMKRVRALSSFVIQNQQEARFAQLLGFHNLLALGL